MTKKQIIQFIEKEAEERRQLIKDYEELGINKKDKYYQEALQNWIYIDWIKNVILDNIKVKGVK